MLPLLYTSDVIYTLLYSLIFVVHLFPPSPLLTGISSIPSRTVVPPTRGPTPLVAWFNLEIPHDGYSTFFSHTTLTFLLPA